MNEENKYFTPDIEDLRIGYECEICTNYGYESFNEGKEIWEKVIIGYKDENGGYKHELTDIIIGIDDGYQPVRVSYLTKEQIEAEGWIENTKNFYAKIGIQMQIFDSYIVIRDNGWYPEQTIFRGECKDINDFRYICKLLKINQNTNEKE